VTLGEGGSEADDGVRVGDVERLAAKLRTRRVDRCERLRDALGIAAGQVDDIVLPELPGEAFHQRKPEVARRPGHHCHTIHDLMYIALADLGLVPERDASGSYSLPRWCQLQASGRGSLALAQKDETEAWAALSSCSRFAAKRAILVSGAGSAAPAIHDN
jgi:hypothetical protein